MNLLIPISLLFLVISGTVSLFGADPAYARPVAERELGLNEAIRVYTEFADGGHRGMDDPGTGERFGYPDEDFDATTAVVVNWHRLPEEVPERDARLRYRTGLPVNGADEDPPDDWTVVGGISREFWHREERVNRVVLRGLEPDTVYEFQVSEDGRTYRFRTMPGSLEDRPVKIIFTGDHQSPDWTQHAHDNARMAAAQKPDLFVVAGDFVNDEGNPSAGNAERWALYLDTLFGVENGYFFYDKEIDGRLYTNLTIPHLAVVGNHEIGEEHHLRWPSGVMTVRSEPGYPRFTAANWTELLFHWPYQSEGFRCELHGDHPNITNVIDGFGHGGFGKLSFGDYLLLIALDNCCQNWAGEPDRGLRDWEGNPITDRWPWYEEHHADVRQDLWLRNLLEPEGRASAGERYRNIIPVYHRGLFGTARKNMTLKNRDLLHYWLPLLHRNNVKFIKEAHDHLYTRTIPLGIAQAPPEGTYQDTVTYAPRSWPLPPDTPQDYLDRYYTINVSRNRETGEIVAWEYQGNYVMHDPGGFIVQGHGGWAASRRQPGDRGGGNAGTWFVDPDKGGETFSGDASYHITTVHLTTDSLTFESFHPSQLEHFLSGAEPTPINRTRWSHTRGEWEILYP
jgi:hypothetical protein